MEDNGGLPGTGAARASEDRASGRGPQSAAGWLRLVAVAVIVLGMLVAILAIWIDEDAWAELAAAVLVTFVVSTFLTLAVQAATQRAARNDARELTDLILRKVKDAPSAVDQNALEMFLQNRFRTQFARYAGQAP